MMNKKKVKFDNTVRYIRLGNANHKPENGIEVESKLRSTCYKKFLRRVFRKGFRFGKN